ncbi:Lipopolysaccharide heptosyltransferase 1 [Candidatus Xiphinematobacter sp. Idaho Grape]|uniref:glycosyltransferase family 9 protein n=1 Tax=Candidatus Xiphinematobacter sp. Idaho Grape TaxID=1704307 RepID=UPI0007063497|nr:glycosyltransferase family 9 protein [Candidatus Xiphinematobacter sp. Idaho Grape]ALJ57008.1 Lipopolysaccharide heptosyltransferase 1 [Candidatus Xiphinematobacter sp. Idaho Grape]
MFPPVSLWIVKPGSLGDIIHALPCASAIRTQWPHTQISWIIDTRWETLLEGNTSVNHRILFPRKHFQGWMGTLRTIEWVVTLLRQEPPEICLDLQGLLRSAIIARCSRAKHIFGLPDSREAAHLFYHHAKFSTTKTLHAVDRYLSILSALGLPYPVCLEFPLPSGFPPKDLPASSNWILLHPFSRGGGKSLSEAAIVRFCEHFDSLPVLIAGIGKLSFHLPSHCTSLLNKTSLLEMIWLCSNASFVVSVDSGPAHVVAAIHGGRLLSLHTRSDPRLVGPYSPDAWIWQGGGIRRQNLSPRAKVLPTKQVGRADVDYIASWLKERLYGTPEGSPRF